MKFSLLLHPGRDDDIITWLEKQPRGEKSSAVREAIRAGLSDSNLDAQSIRYIVREELAQAELTVTSADDADAHEASSAITEDVDPEAGQRLDNLF